MKTSEVVLLVLDAYGGSIAGKTLVQKVCYFVDVSLDLDMRFRAHYYGPYSPLIEDALGELKSLGFIKEQHIGFGLYNPSFGEIRRFDYDLTEDGKTVVSDIKNRMTELYDGIGNIVDKIKGAGDPTYMDLSVAAKCYFILKERGRPMTNKEITKEAGKFKWKLTTKTTNNAIALLNQLGLSKTT